MKDYKSTKCKECIKNSLGAILPCEIDRNCIPFKFNEARLKAIRKAKRRATNDNNI